MQITNFQAGNTYIFTEKDLPGYTSKSKTKPKVGLEDLNSKFPPIPTRLLQVERDRRGGPPKWEKGKRWQPYFRKAIPSIASPLKAKEMSPSHRIANTW
jgi:transcription initiation factor TFIIF subunit beta